MAPRGIVCSVDLLDLLLQERQENVQERLCDALDRDAPAIEEIAFNAFEVALDRERNEAQVFDVLDGNAAPTIVALDELRLRLA